MIRSVTLEHSWLSKSRPSRDPSTGLGPGEDLTPRTCRGCSFHPIDSGSIPCDSCDDFSGCEKWKKDSAISSRILTLVILTHDPSLPACFLVFCLALCVPSCSHVRCWGSDGAGTGDSVLLDLWPGPRPDCLGESGELQTCLPSVRLVLSGAWGVRVLCESFRAIRSLADLVGARVGVFEGAGPAGRPHLEILSTARRSCA